MDASGITGLEVEQLEAETSKPDKRTIEGPSGRRISFELSGEGEPLILLPPGASPAQAWRNVSKSLTDRYLCVAVNHSGYGETQSFVGARPMTLCVSP